MTIQLNDVQFYGYHGLYKEEQELGNTFIVNLAIDFVPSVESITNINETIDYVQVYELIKTRMQIPTPLLETIAEDIATNIFEPIRLHFGKPILVSSGYRSKELNAAVPGSSRTSQHCSGEALDLDQDSAAFGITNAMATIFLRFFLIQFFINYFSSSFL